MRWPCLRRLGCIGSVHRLDAQHSALLALRVLCRAFDRLRLLLLLARVGVACVSTFASDRGHVLAVAADRFAALAACDVLRPD